MNKRIYVTTPIYYANGFPHIGHLLTTTCADVYARYKRLKLGTENVFFTTGLDEHGTTVAQSAQKEGRTDYQEYVDERARFWKKAFEESTISFDYFVRTTNEDHIKFAQDFIRKIIKNGDIYKGKYIGKYCYGCEKFLTKSDLNEKGLCPLHRPDQVADVEEENYYFRLSKYAKQVADLIKSGKLQILPEGKKNEILARIEQGVSDQSISRPRDKVSWAVPFPDDDSQTVYVWVEALLNYLSSLHITGKSDEEQKSFWEGVVHFMGKDINWFHNLIWPALLLSAGYPVAKKTFVHSYLNVSGQKISKSLGNIITPSDLIEKYGIDATRYLILANTPYRNDVDVTWEALNATYNADLANGLGNLVSRVAKLASTLSENPIKDFHVTDHPNIEKAYEEFRFNHAIDEIRKLISHVDEYINNTEPWKKKGYELAKTLEGPISEILDIAEVIAPVMPGTSQKIKTIFAQKNVSPAKPLFVRIKSD